MGKLDKFKDIIGIGAAIGKEFLPPSGGRILDGVTKILAESGDPASAASQDALIEIAQENDQQTEAIFALANEVQKLRAEVAELKKKVG